MTSGALAFRFGLLAASCLLPFACTPGGDDSSPPDQGSSGGRTGNTDIGDPDIDDCLDGGCLPAPPAGCGDGILTADEACDDANLVDGDGCSSNCLTVEPGYSCAIAGQLCYPIAKCGDGLVSDPEFCDDGNTEGGDGCSPRCTFELGFTCEGEPSSCRETVCGDNKTEGAESCDDGNALPFDGCSARCQLEPDCSSGACTSSCGDGIVIGEECDDGNSRSGDGCSNDCKIEAGFECAPATTVGDTLEVPIIYRDFMGSQQSPANPLSHPDFHHGNTVDPNSPRTGMVNVNLGSNGKPVFSGSPNAFFIDSSESFAEWYQDGPKAKTYAETLSLTKNGVKFGFDDPLFFPLDGRGWAAAPATENLYSGDDGPHNFAFTSEVRYWIEYDPALNANLSFRGDDDVFVFVNGKLVLDLGGVHNALTGSFTLNASTQDTAGNNLGLTTGKVYEIAVFQAERNPGGSNYKLELTNFNASSTVCSPVCGDGILSIGEQCDDGENLGGYGKCAAGCLLGEYCGDGVVQGPEDCDDGNRVDGDSCNNSCRVLVVK